MATGNTTIQLRRSVTTGHVPASLANGELAVNIPDFRVFVGNGSAAWDAFQNTSSNLAMATGTHLTVGNSTVNSTINVTMMSSLQVNTLFLYVGANTTFNSGAGQDFMTIGNSTVNAIISAIAFQFNTNLTANATTLSVGNSTVNAFVNAFGLTVANSTATATYGPQAPGATPGSPSTGIQYNNSGAFAANANFTYNYSTNLLALLANSVVNVQSNGSAIFITGQVNSTVNSSLIANTTSLFVGNSSANANHTGTGLTVANATISAKYGPGGPSIKVTTNTVNGTYTPIANLLYVVVECIGAGGGGAGCSNGGTNPAVAGGGGAGGTYSKRTFTAAQINSIAVAYTIGIAGAGGANGTTGVATAGTATIFPNTTNQSFLTLSGTGGGAGFSGNSTVSGGAGANPGAQWSNADISVQGLPGGTGSRYTAATAIANNGSLAGYGGDAGLAYGYGGISVSIQSVAASSNGGFSGQLYGGGGGGAATSNTAAAVTAGGAGANGLIIITEYYLS